MGSFHKGGRESCTLIRWRVDQAVIIHQQVPVNLTQHWIVSTRMAPVSRLGIYEVLLLVYEIEVKS